MALQLNQSDVQQVAHEYASAVSFRFNLRYAFLFGSYAKGTADEDSDIDIAVVADDFSGDQIDDTLSLLKLRRGIDTRIEPHAFLTDEFLSENPDPFVAEIINTGIRIDGNATVI
jgi:predicted nucleotidyltransferase